MNTQRPLRAKPQRDWKVTVVLGLTMAVVAMLAVGTPAVISSSNTGRQIQRGADIQGCRSAANADVTDARNTVDQRRVDNDALENEFIDALTNGDAPRIADLRTRFQPTRQALVAAALVLDKKNDQYQEAIKLSQSNSEKFLKNCHMPATPDPIVPTSTTLLFPTTSATSPTTVAPSTTVRRATTSTTRPSTSTSGTTSTTVYPSSTTPTAPPTTCAVPVTVPGVPCL